MTFTVCNRKCNYRTLSRVLLLPFIVLCVLPYIPNEYMAILINPYYMIPIYVVTTLLLFHSIPHATNYIYAKNVEFADLIDTHEITDEARHKYIRYHRWILFALLSLAIGAIVYYYEFIYKLRDHNIYIMFAVVRGVIIQTFLDVQKKSAECLKTILYKYKEYKIKQRASIGVPQISIELTTIKTHPLIGLTDITVADTNANAKVITT